MHGENSLEMFSHGSSLQALLGNSPSACSRQVDGQVANSRQKDIVQPEKVTDTAAVSGQIDMHQGKAWVESRNTKKCHQMPP